MVSRACVKYRLTLFFLFLNCFVLPFSSTWTSTASHPSPALFHIPFIDRLYLEREFSAIGTIHNQPIMEDSREHHQKVHKSSHVPQECNQIINIDQPSSTDLATNLTRSPGGRAQCRSLEWHFFIDNGPYLTKDGKPAK